MDIALLATVKDRLGISQAEVQHDAVLSALITSVSQDIENFLDRKFLTTSYTDYFDVRSDSTWFSLKAYPVSSLTSVYCDPEWDYDSSSAVSADYRQMDSENGILFIHDYMLTTGFRALKVTYTGGMGATYAAFLSSYPSIVRACEEQVCFLFNLRGKEGTSSINSMTGSVSFLSYSGLQRGLVHMLQPYRRKTYV